SGHERDSTLASAVFGFQPSRGDQPRRGCQVLFGPVSGTTASAADPTTDYATPASVRGDTAVVALLCVTVPGAVAPRCYRRRKDCRTLRPKATCRRSLWPMRRRLAVKVRHYLDQTPMT